MAPRLTLEIAVNGDTEVDMVSEYRPVPGAQGGPIADVGDLMGGETRHLVMRSRTRRLTVDGHVTPRARVRWMDEGGARETVWRELIPTVATRAQRDHRGRP